jgi:hypothetical protein
MVVGGKWARGVGWGRGLFCGGWGGWGGFLGVDKGLVGWAFVGTHISGSRCGAPGSCKGKGKGNGNSNGNSTGNSNGNCNGNCNGQYGGPSLRSG